MLNVIQNLAPQAFIILMGFLLTRTGFFSESALKGLRRFAFAVAIPIMLFYTMAKLELPAQPPWALWGTYIGGTLSLMVCVYAFSRAKIKQSAPSAATMAIAGGFSNLVVLGIPFNLSVIGPSATFSVYSIITVHAFSLLVCATIMAELKSGRRWLGSILKTAKDTVSNPVIIGLMSGVFWSYLDLPMPRLLDETIASISTAALPLALFALGGTLAGLQLKGDVAKLTVMISSKLILHPLWISFLALFVFELPPNYAAVCILSACLPTGINGFLFASHYSQSERSVAGLILITTPLGLLLYAFVASLLLG